MSTPGTAPSLLTRILRRFFPEQSLVCLHEKENAGAWLTTHIPRGRWTPPTCHDAALIRQRLQETEGRGKQKLWEGYAKLSTYQRTDTERTAKEVSTFGPLGNFFAWLVEHRKPQLLVEIGSAFGLSGMHWVSGLKSAGSGRLLTFEPNDLWAGQAEANIRAVGESFTLVRGTFEEKIEQHLPKDHPIDMAFIDAIHTSEFVNAQYALVKARATADALIVIDDIDFSENMAACWKSLVQSNDVRAAVSFGRVGIVELGK